jgi:hypothetical protein
VTYYCLVATRSSHKIVVCPVRGVNKPRFGTDRKDGRTKTKLLAGPQPVDPPFMVVIRLGRRVWPLARVSFSNYSKAVSTSTRLQAVSNADVTSTL